MSDFSFVQEIFEPSLPVECRGHSAAGESKCPLKGNIPRGEKAVLCRIRINYAFVSFYLCAHCARRTGRNLFFQGTKLWHEL